jgi:mannose-6-phosphate isomerase-like protein (cupin superfamily)
MQYKYTLNTDKQVGRPTVRGYGYNSKADFERLSCGVFTTNSRHGLIKNVRSDRLYLILEGEGEFTVGNQTFAVKQDDVVIVPRSTPYDYQGQLKVFLVHSPANDDEADISLEEPPTPDEESP